MIVCKKGENYMVGIKDDYYKALYKDFNVSTKNKVKLIKRDELKDKIMKCTKLVEIEDLYRPFKEKKKTCRTSNCLLLSSGRSNCLDKNACA